MLEKPSNLSKTLGRQYALILGKLRQAEKLGQPRQDDLDETLAAIQIVIQIWEPNWTPEHIQPIRPKRRYVEHGLQSRILHQFIREQSGEFTADEAAIYLSNHLRALGKMPPSPEYMKKSAHSLFRKCEENFLTALGKRPEIWTKRETK